MKNIISAFIVLLSMTTTSTAQNLLEDPSLELATGSSLTSNSAWVANADLEEGPAGQFQSAGWASNPRGSTDNGSVGFWMRSFRGTTAEPVDAELYQDVAAGPGEYSFGAFIYHEVNFSANAAGIEAVAYSGGTGGTVTGSSMIDLFTVPEGPISEGGSVDNFAETLNTLVAGPGTDTIRLRLFMEDGINAGIDPQSILVDDFTLAAVPEPSSAALFVLAVAGLAMCRRR